MPDIKTIVNGVETSYCSIELMVSGLRIKKVKSINYKDTGDIPKIRGTSATPVGRTRGTSDAEGDIEIYRSEMDLLLPLLTLAGAVGYMESSHVIGVTFAELMQLPKTRTDMLEGVRFFGLDAANTEGGDAATVKFGLSIMNIQWHGLYQALRRSVV
jgi:hypothetical protein